MEKHINLARLLDIAASDLIFALKELSHQLATLERALAFRFEESERKKGRNGKGGYGRPSGFVS